MAIPIISFEFFEAFREAKRLVKQEFGVSLYMQSHDWCERLSAYSAQSANKRLAELVQQLQTGVVFVR